MEKYEGVKYEGPSKRKYKLNGVEKICPESQNKSL